MASSRLVIHVFRLKTPVVSPVSVAAIFRSGCITLEETAEPGISEDATADADQVSGVFIARTWPTSPDYIYLFKKINRWLTALKGTIP